MSSTNSPVAAGTPTKQATKAVVPRKSAAAKAEAAAAEALAASAPIVMEKKAKGVKAKAAATAAVAPPPPPPTDKKTGGRKRKVEPAADVDEAAAAAAVPVPKKKSKAAVGADESEAGKKVAVKKPREVKPRPTYIEAYGDWEKPEAERVFSEEEHEAWRDATIARVNEQSFKDWVRAKKAFYKGVKALVQARKKRAQKLVDSQATSEKQLARLLAAADAPTASEDKVVGETVITAAEWASLDGVYLAGHGFSGVFSAAEIEAAVLPDKAVPIYTVYRAAVEKGLHPLGIVSETRKKNKVTGVMEYVTNVEQQRVYVGIGMPIQDLEASPFARKNSDRVFAGEESSDAAPAE